MIRNFLVNPFSRRKFLHYFIIISALMFLFTLGPRILVDQLSQSHPNTAAAQDCGQQTCPPPVCSEQPRDYTQCGGECNGTTFPDNHMVMVHKSVDSACSVSFQCDDQGAKEGECGNSVPQPPQPPPAQTCEKDKVIRTERDQSKTCVGNQLCSRNIQVREDCSEYAGGFFDCRNEAGQCGFSNPAPPPPVPQPPVNNCGGLTLGESTCQNGHQVTCTNEAVCNGGQCIVDHGGTCGNGSSGGNNNNSCADQLNNCSCNGTNFICNHQHSDCSNTSETHNERGTCQVNNVCQDQLFNCVCSGTNFQCTHQTTNCSTTTETHNELAGASACRAGVCTDQLTSCACSGTNLQCIHQRSDCSTVSETHNELAGAANCRAVVTPPPPPPAAGGNSSSSSNSAANSNSNSTANANANANQTQSQSTNINNNNVNNNSNSNSQNQTVNVGGTVLALATASPSPTPTPSPGTTTTIFVPATNTVIIGRGGTTVAPAQVSGTKVLGQVQELPNTGLPAIGLILFGLAPIGWKMRRYAFNKMNLNPSLIWMNREIKR